MIFVSFFFLPQGLVSMNHILPREYLDVLVVLQDRALSRKAREVSKEERGGGEREEEKGGGEEQREGTEEKKGRERRRKRKRENERWTDRWSGCVGGGVEIGRLNMLVLYGQ